MQSPTTGDLSASIFALPELANPLSKNAQKKQLKRERLAAAKLERKAAKKNARKRAREEDPPPAAEKLTSERASKRRKDNSSPSSQFHATLIVDLGFDHLMYEKEIVSLCNQLSYVYASNRRAPKAFERIFFTGLDGRTRERLGSIGDGTAHKRWHGVSWFEVGYEKLWKQIEENENTSAGQPHLLQSTIEQANTIYLTADSGEELEELKEGDTYILGGICDHNRYKNLCLLKAQQQKIRTARLPIGRFMANLQTRKVLTVNQVFDIMLTWIENKDWAAAFARVIPPRKLKGVSASGRKSDEIGDEDQD